MRSARSGALDRGRPAAARARAAAVARGWARAIWPNALRCKSTTAFPMRTLFATCCAPGWTTSPKTARRKLMTRLPFDHRRPGRHPRGHLHARSSPGLVFLAAQGHRVRHPRHHHQARWHGLLGAGYRRAVGNAGAQRSLRRMAQRGGMDDEAREWLHEKRAEADAALANIDQRRQALHRFGVFLAEVQYDFFMGGEARMRPLTMQQAADALGVHVSTISRTVQDKYALTPWGVFPLKHFFSSSVACSAEDRRHALSSLAIKDRIKDLVAQEDRRTPLSDATITAILNARAWTSNGEPWRSTARRWHRSAVAAKTVRYSIEREGSVRGISKRTRDRGLEDVRQHGHHPRRQGAPEIARSWLRCRARRREPVVERFRRAEPCSAGREAANVLRHRSNRRCR